MNAEFQDPTTTESEPTSTLAVAPVWLIVSVLVLAFWGAVYFDKHGGWFNAKVYSPYRSIQDLQVMLPGPGTADPFGRGKAVYHKPSCVLCHQANGQGTSGQFPPLAGSDWVLEPEPGRIIRAVLHGMQGGPIQINGQSFNFSASMVPWKDTFTDEEIADVLTYVRQEWGNKAPEVKRERVKEVREKTKDRTTPFTPDELMKISPAE
jgi:mono/diheme cytochrome c family protein